MGQQVRSSRMFCSDLLMNAWQFAYNEMSYFLTRLLQTFSSISLAEEVQTLAPAEWAKGSGRKAVEKVIIRSHLTAYIQVGASNVTAYRNAYDRTSRTVYGLGWKRPEMLCNSFMTLLVTYVAIAYVISLSLGLGVINFGLPALSTTRTMSNKVVGILGTREHSLVL
jgi:hypothetical protein